MLVSFQACCFYPHLQPFDQSCCQRMLSCTWQFFHFEFEPPFLINNFAKKKWIMDRGSCYFEINTQRDKCYDKKPATFAQWAASSPWECPEVADLWTHLVDRLVCIVDIILPEMQLQRWPLCSNGGDALWFYCLQEYYFAGMDHSSMNALNTCLISLKCFFIKKNTSMFHFTLLEAPPSW